MNIAIIIQTLREVYGNLKEMNVNVSTANSTYFKYKSRFFKLLDDADNGVFKNVKIAVPLK